MRPKLRLNTAEEEVAIQRGIALDIDNPELDDNFFATARPAREVLPPQLYAELTASWRQTLDRKPSKG